MDYRYIHWFSVSTRLAKPDRQQIEALIRRLRGNLRLVAPPHPLARFVTDIPALAAPAPAPPYPAHLLPGQKILSAPEIEAHLTHTLAAGRAAATIGTSYPTGQDFTTRTIDQLWTDCDVITNGTTLTDINTGVPELPTQKQIRQKLALKELMRRHSRRAKLIQRIFAHEEGQTPRPFVSLASEDRYIAGAHTCERHVLGTGTGIDTLLDLAMRACTKTPPCGVAASGFNNLASADGVVSATLNASLVANWVTWRRYLTQGDVLPPFVQPLATGIRLRKTDNPKHIAYLAPFNPAAYAPRPLIGPAPGGVPPLGLTHYTPVGGVRVLVKASNHLEAHGWAVYTAYPDR